jgi:hypothetical protein
MLWLPQVPQNVLRISARARALHYLIALFSVGAVLLLGADELGAADLGLDVTAGALAKQFWFSVYASQLEKDAKPTLVTGRIQSGACPRSLGVFRTAR